MEKLKAHRDESTGRWTLEGVEPSEKTFDRMCQMLRDGENFKFARFGDGEANCMLGKIGKNCDGHEYFPDLGQALNDAFYSDPKYMVGIQPLMVQQGMWDKLISQREGYPKNIYDADVLHSASIDGRLIEIFEACVGRVTIMVGPKHLSSIANVFIKVPDVNCWKEYDEVCELLDYQLKFGRDNDDDSANNPVVFLCASMMSEVIIHRFKDADCTIIDAGSVFSPYFGVLNRSYHYKLKLNAN